MIKIIVISFVCVLFVFRAVADRSDSSATITSAKNSYQFIYNSRLGRVEVKELLNTFFTSNAYQVSLPVAEIYNNEITIDDVDARVDKHAAHDFKPSYSYYSTANTFFSDEKMCYFSLMLPKKGSTANVVFNETVNDPRYFTTVYFSEDWGIQQKEVTFKIPRWMNVELKEMNFGKYQIHKTSVYDSKDDADIITYTIQNLPAIKKEENSPGPSYLYPHLMILCKSAAPGGHNFKYFGTLDDQYAWYRSLVKNINNNNEVIAAKAKELTAGSTSDIDKIKAVFYYVQDNIRYLAFEDGMAGFIPERADEVLRKKYGDCKGMANLTKALLTSLGYDARLCWLGTDYIAYDYQTPSLAVDNHMICGLMYKGRTIYLDATETYIGLNEYAQRIQGRQVLMEDGDKYILGKIPLAADTQNFDNEISSLSIEGTNLKGIVSHIWKGEDKEAFLTGLNSAKREKADEAATRFLSNNNNDYEVKDLKLSSTANPDHDLAASYTLNYKNGVSEFSKAYYVDLDFEKELINSAIKIDERKHDYWFDYKMNISKEAELNIPANYLVAAVPEPLDIINPYYEFHIRYQNNAGKLVYKKTILIKNTRLPASGFMQWNKDIEQLAKTYNETVTLKPLSE